MMLATGDDWLAAGLEALAEFGLPGVRIDRIAARLGVSKGSFHHHFDGAEAYRRALLQRYEEQATQTAQRSACLDQGQALLSQRLEQLDRLVESFDTLYDARIETAMRAWALHDDDARQVVSRVDDARLQMLQDVWASALPHQDMPRTAALVPHLVIIGASASPTTSAEDLGSVLRLLTRLARAVPDSADASEP
jgi:AcrR family transcriptional regulator